MKILNSQEIIKILASQNNQKEKDVKNYLMNLGLNIITDEARRLQLSEAFKEKRLLNPNEPIPMNLIQESYKSITEI